jgi:hypothetical protein
VLLAILGASLVFNHGCHGDEDTELTAGKWWIIGGADGRDWPQQP